MIKDMIIFDNGVVAVFNQDGKQIRELQGIYTERKQILMYLMKKYPRIHVTGDIHQGKYLGFKEWPFYFPYLMHFLELT